MTKFHCKFVQSFPTRQVVNSVSCVPTLKRHTYIRFRAAWWSSGSPCRLTPLGPGFESSPGLPVYMLSWGFPHPRQRHAESNWNYQFAHRYEWCVWGYTWMIWCPIQCCSLPCTPRLQTLATLNGMSGYRKGTDVMFICLSISDLFITSYLHYERWEQYFISVYDSTHHKSEVDNKRFLD